MSDPEEEEDVDSGWDVGEGGTVTSSAVPPASADLESSLETREEAVTSTQVTKPPPASAAAVATRLAPPPAKVPKAEWAAGTNDPLGLDLDDLEMTAVVSGEDLAATVEAPALSKEELRALLGPSSPESARGVLASTEGSKARAPTLKSDGTKPLGEGEKASALDPKSETDPSKPKLEITAPPPPLTKLQPPAKTLAERIALAELAEQEGGVEPSSMDEPTSGAPTVRGSVDMLTHHLAFAKKEEDDPEPLTRRADDDESAAVKTTATKSPPMRLAGRRVTPVLSNAADAAKKADARFHSRPTPPATAAATTALKFSAQSLVDARNRRKTTKINLQALELARQTSADEQKKNPSSPFVDLQLGEGFDVPEIPKRVDDAAASRKPVGDEARTSSPSAKTAPAIPAARAAGAGVRGALGGGAPSEGMAAATKAVEPAAAEPSSPGAALRPPPSKRTPASPIAAPSKPGRREAPTVPNAPAQRGRDKVPTLAAPQAETSAPSIETGSDVDVDLDFGELSAEEEAALSEELGTEPREAEPAPADDDAAPRESRPSIDELDEPGESLRSASAPKTARASEEDPQLTPIRTRFERGDYLGALLRAEALLETRPDFEEAKRYAQSAQELLHQMYLERLGSGEQVLRVAMDASDIQRLSLDHRAGFLISLIDGVATVDEILDMSGMPALDALRLLFEMREQGVVAVDSLARP